MSYLLIYVYLLTYLNIYISVGTFSVLCVFVSRYLAMFFDIRLSCSDIGFAHCAQFKWLFMTFNIGCCDCSTSSWITVV